MEITLNYQPSCQICKGCVNAVYFPDTHKEVGCQVNVSLPAVGLVECNKRVDDSVPDLTNELQEITPQKVVDE